MTSWWDRHVTPRLIGCACSRPPIMAERARLVPQARGRVLELGFGGGLNFRFYDPAKVETVFGVDPSAELRERAGRAPRPAELKLDLRDGVGEALPFEDGAFDTVVCTFTLCSVADPAVTLAEARRVLKAGGGFLFCEHGLSPDRGVAAWQRRIEPVWTRLAGGCRLTRTPAATIEACGLTPAAVERAYLRGVPKIAGWCERGVAVAR